MKHSIFTHHYFFLLATNRIKNYGLRRQQCRHWQIKDGRLYAHALFICWRTIATLEAGLWHEITVEVVGRILVMKAFIVQQWFNAFVVELQPRVSNSRAHFSRERELVFVSSPFPVWWFYWKLTQVLAINIQFYSN